jgi:hypothetical protein
MIKRLPVCLDRFWGNSATLVPLLQLIVRPLVDPSTRPTTHSVERRRCREPFRSTQRLSRGNTDLPAKKEHV